MLHVVSSYELVYGVHVALDPRLLIEFADESFVLFGLRHSSFLLLSRPVLARMPPVTRQPVYPASPVAQRLEPACPLCKAGNREGARDAPRRQHEPVPSEHPLRGVGRSHGAGARASRS